MNAIQPIAETEDTVTLSRADFALLLGAIGDLKDATLLDADPARDEEGGAGPAPAGGGDPLAAGA